MKESLVEMFCQDKSSDITKIFYFEKYVLLTFGPNTQWKIGIIFYRKPFYVKTYRPSVQIKLMNVDINWENQDV